MGGVLQGRAPSKQWCTIMLEGGDAGQRTPRGVGPPPSTVGKARRTHTSDRVQLATKKMNSELATSVKKGEGREHDTTKKAT